MAALNTAVKRGPSSVYTRAQTTRVAAMSSTSVSASGFQASRVGSVMSKVRVNASRHRSTADSAGAPRSPRRSTDVMLGSARLTDVFSSRACGPSATAAGPAIPPAPWPIATAAALRSGSGSIWASRAASSFV